MRGSRGIGRAIIVATMLVVAGIGMPVAHASSIGAISTCGTYSGVMELTADLHAATGNDCINTNGDLTIYLRGLAITSDSVAVGNAIDADFQHKLTIHGPGTIVGGDQAIFSAGHTVLNDNIHFSGVIYVAGAGSSINHVIDQGSGGNGIEIQAPNAKVTNNWVFQSTGNGIAVQHGKGSIVSGNTVRQNGEDGIIIDPNSGKSVTVRGNTADNNSGAGIYAPTGTPHHKNTATGNAITQCDPTYLCSSGPATIGNISSCGTYHGTMQLTSDVSGSGYGFTGYGCIVPDGPLTIYLRGLAISSTGPIYNYDPTATPHAYPLTIIGPGTLDGNVASDARTTIQGLIVVNGSVWLDAAKSSVSGITVNGASATDPAIETLGSKSKVSANWVLHGGGDGIDVIGSSTKVFGNTSNQNSGSGIIVDPGTTGVKVKNNVAESNSNDGISAPTATGGGNEARLNGGTDCDPSSLC